MATPTNPCSEVQTISVASGGSYTITLPNSTSIASTAFVAPIGTVQVMANGGPMNAVGTVNVMKTDAGWARLDIDDRDLKDFSREVLTSKLSEIESLFDVVDKLSLGNTPFVSLDDKAREYNRFEEELIRRDELCGDLTDTLAKFKLQVELIDPTIDTRPGSLAHTIMSSVANEIENFRADLDSLL